ncbi:hypothetical protein [Bradyrhizobium sp. USDA 4451]
MPERYGFTCVVGGYLLESFVVQAPTTSEYGSGFLGLHHKLLHEVADFGNVVEASIARARILDVSGTHFPPNELINQGLLAGSRNFKLQGKQAHVAGLANGATTAP